MKTFALIIFGIIVVVAISRDRASYRMIEIMLPPDQMVREHIHFKSLIPGYATWKLTKIRREMNEQYSSENNPKQG